VAIASGANMNFGRLRFVAERSDDMEALISVIVPEQPGSFRRLYECINPRNVTGFSYRYSSPEKAYVIMSFNVSSHEDTISVISTINSNGMEALDLSDNEMAKVHGKFLVGGRSPGVIRI
jgi:threonine dehydratase